MPESFAVAACFVRALGGREAIEKMRKKHESEVLAKSRARKVDKRSFLNEFDQEHLMGNTFAHRKNKAR